MIVKHSLRNKSGPGRINLSNFLMKDSNAKFIFITVIYIIDQRYLPEKCNLKSCNRVFYVLSVLFS